MTIKNLFLIFRKNAYEQELSEKLTSIERNIEVLKQSFQALQEQSPQDKVAETVKEPPIIIEKINIEKVILDKYEVNNNFGQLGIKELKGKLNIGATYGSEFTPKLKDEDKEETRDEKVTYKQEDKKPKINIQAKREKA